jgi:integrase
MSVGRRKDRDNRWAYRTVVKLPDGTRERVSGFPDVNTKEAAKEAERLHIERVKRAHPKRSGVPTFGEWFWGPDPDAEQPQGRFWKEWVIGRKNKPSEVESKVSIYVNHLRDAFGDMPLDAIDVTAIAQFRAHLVALQPPRTEKTINNILAVLSKPLNYAEDVQLIVRAPKVGLFKIERPEIDPWELDEYQRIVEAARGYKYDWYVAVLLAGEAGLRIGEVKALRWQDVDMKAGMLTVAQQVRHGAVGTPKGRNRRTIPMTALLTEALRGTNAIRTGYVMRTADGKMYTDNQAEWAITAICDRAGLPLRKWHALRHSYGTHAALFAVNPWSLMTWMGHKRLEETMIYVNVAKAHLRAVPPHVLAAGEHERDPDRRIIAMLGARCATKRDTKEATNART